MDNNIRRKKIGQRIKSLRKLNGLTQEHLAHILGLGGNSSISQVEAGTMGLTQENYDGMARVLGVPIDVLLSDVEYSPDDLWFFRQTTKLIKSGNPAVKEAVRALLSVLDK